MRDPMPETLMEKEPSVSELFDLSGQTALITGATGYLGKAMARGLAEAGCRVVVSSRQQSRAEELATSLPTRNETTHLVAEIDQLDESSILTGFARAVAEAGNIDILINNAHEVMAKDWRSVNGKEFDRQMQNLTGYFLLSRELYRHATSTSSRGSIVMLGSMYGVTGSYPPPPNSEWNFSPAAYHGLKGGVVQLTRHLACCWARDGVRVNCLSPGPCPNRGGPLKVVERKEVPMGRHGMPHEMKGAAVFLASEASSYVTGHNLLVDGGWTAW
jgi:NAD(P)-dependent dehydrogenase (short-subunit alcohol dehydrogenase family)